MPSDAFYRKWLAQDERPSTKPARQTSLSSIADDIELVTSRIEAACIDITADYGDWCNLGFAIADALGENGRSTFHRISSVAYSGYDYNACDRQYDNCLNGKGHGVTYRTFFQIAQDHGIDISPSQPSLASLPSRTSAYEDFKNITTDTRDGNDANDGNDGITHIEMPTFYPKIHGHLPTLLQKVADKRDSDADADMLILGSLAVISACLPKVFGIYDKRVTYTNLYLFVTAGAGTGKGRLYFCHKLVEPIHNDLRVKNEFEEAEYKMKMAAYKHPKKGEVVPKPDAPPVRLLFIPANSSSTAVYQALAENDERGLMFETEGDTLSSSFGQDFGDFSDGLRKAFHHEKITFLRRGEREYRDIKCPRLSTVLSGTPEQVATLLTSAENGLFSRFLFYYLDSEITWHDVLDEGDGQSLDSYFADLGNEFHPFYHTLLGMENMLKFSMTPKQAWEFNHQFSIRQDEFLNLFGATTVASVRRIATSTFRIAMILTALRMMDTGEIPESLVCSDEDFRTAMIISDVLHSHMLRVMKEMPASPGKMKVGQAKEPVLLKKFWDELPDEFEAKDFKAIAADVGLSTPTAERYIREWLGKRLEKLSRGKYRKLS